MPGVRRAEDMASDTARGATAAGGGGVAAYLLGYLFTYILAGPSIQESDLNRIIDAVGEGDVAWKLVGWVFYNAHGVTTTLDIDVPFIGGTDVVNFIAQGNGLSPVLYVLPPALLLAAGLAGVRVAGTAALGDALRIGPAVAVGYLPLAVAGAVLFSVTVRSSVGGPTLVTAIGLAGVVYPLLFGTAGTALGVVLADRTGGG
jgi:hypothetical protein